MSELLLKLLVLILILVVLGFVLLKEIKKLRNKNKIKSNNLNEFEKKDSKPKEDKRNISFTQEDNRLEKLAIKLEDMIDRDDVESENKSNLNFFSTVINNDNDFVRSAKDSIVLDEQDFKIIGNNLNLKVGSEISSMIKRVDNDGNIVLGMEALKFITGDNIPLITPQGSIRVLNLLTLEDDFLVSIRLGKPLFILDKENNSVVKIEKEDLDALAINKEDLDKLKIIDEKNRENIELLKRNNFLEESIEEFKNKVLKLEAINEVYEKISNKVQVEKIIAEDKRQQNNQKVTSASENEPEVIKTEIKQEEVKVENIAPIQKENKVEQKQEEVKVENIAPIQKENKVEQKQEEVKVENIAPIQKEKSELKAMNKKTADVCIEEFFLRYLLGKNGGDNRELKANDLIFITYKQESFAKIFTLKYLYSNTIKEMKKFLVENNYSPSSENINLILENKKIKIKENAFFTSSKDMQMYKSKIIEVNLSQDEVAPYALINEKQNGYKGGYTKEEITELEDDALDKKTQAIHQRSLSNIMKNNFKEVM